MRSSNKLRPPIRLSALIVLAGLVLATEAGAQVAWDAPLLAPPRPPAGTGVYLGNVAGGGLGVMLGWRNASLGRDFGWRIGLAEGRDGGDVSGYAGFDLNGMMNRASRDMPLDIAWVAGGGFSVGNAAVLSIPFGVSMGHTLAGSDGVRLTPYLAPRLTIDALFDSGQNDALDLSFSVDLGADLALSRGAIFRLGGTVGNRDAVAFGIVF